MDILEKMYNVLETIFDNDIDENFKFYIKGKKGKIQLPSCVYLEKVDLSLVDFYVVEESRVTLYVSS